MLLSDVYEGTLAYRQKDQVNNALIWILHLGSPALASHAPNHATLGLTHSPGTLIALAPNLLVKITKPSFP
jgi:hypothetical protein